MVVAGSDSNHSMRNGINSSRERDACQVMDDSMMSDPRILSAYFIIYLTHVTKTSMQMFWEKSH